MSSFVFAAVLVAAFLHATWNVVVKISLDRFLAMFLLQSLMGVMGIVILLVFSPPGVASLPFAFASGLLHTGYNLFLARSYRTGDLGLVYPVARGTAPLLTLFGSYLFTQDPVSHLAALGIVILIVGIWLIALSPAALKSDRTTLAFAFGTSVFIGLYTVVDGLGGRISGAASGYTGVVFILDAIFMLITGVALRGPGIFRAVAPFWRSGIVGAAASGSAYWTVIWAMSLAPIAMVAALRETSILFAVAFSARFLKEPLSFRRVLGALLVVAGAMALRG